MPIVDIESARIAANVLYERGVEHVVITLGREGAFLYNAFFAKHIPGVVTNAIDTTAAGDVFNGALAVALTAGKPIELAVEFANRAAAFSVGRAGAQVSAPHSRDLV